MTEYRNNKHAQRFYTVARTFRFPTNEDFPSLNITFYKFLFVFFCFALFCYVCTTKEKVHGKESQVNRVWLSSGPTV